MGSDGRVSQQSTATATSTATNNNNRGGHRRGVCAVMRNNTFRESDALVADIKFAVGGVMILVMFILGIIGNMLLFILLSKQAVHKTFHNLFVLLSVYDTMYLVSALFLFSLPHLIPEFLQSTAYPYLVMLFLPLGHIGMIGSMFTTLALSVERYIAVLHPFAKYRRWYKTRRFTIPVVIYSVLYNLPKFFEFELACVSNQAQAHHVDGNAGAPLLHEDLGPSDGNGSSRCVKQFVATPMRSNYWYLKIYGLWMNSLLNIVFPLIIILVINFMVYRKLIEHAAQNILYQSPERKTNIRLQQERFMRRREVNISIINIYVAIMILLCHSIRVVPNVWEIVMAIGEDSDNFQEPDWPPWLDVLVEVSHLALTICSSLNFYIYMLKYRSIRMQDRRDATRQNCGESVFGRAIERLSRNEIYRTSFFNNGSARGDEET